MVLGVIGLTGATGMLGRHVAAALQGAGYAVRAVGRRLQAKERGGLWDLAEWRSDAEFDALFPDVRAVVHAGALVPGKEVPGGGVLYDVNVRSCANLGLWAHSRSIPLVFVSSASVYADPDAGYLSEGSDLGANQLGGPYGMSKLMAEDVLNRYKASGLKLAVVRPSVLYGYGGMASKMPYRLLDTAVRGEAIELTAPLEDCFDFVHAADVSSAIVQIIDCGCWETFNIASGSSVTVHELAQACVDAAGQGSVELSGAAGARPPSHRYLLDTGKIRQRLGWHPRVGIRQGLSMVLAGRLMLDAFGVDEARQ